MGPICRSDNLACLRSRWHAAVGRVGIVNSLSGALAVNIGTASIALKFVGDATPITNVGNIVRRVSGGKASSVVGVDVTDHDNIAFHARIVGCVGAAAAIGVRPVGIHRVAVLHG